MYIAEANFNKKFICQIGQLDGLEVSGSLFRMRLETVELS